MAGGSKNRRQGGGGGFACCAASPRAEELPLRQPASPQVGDDPGTPPRSTTPDPVRASKTPEPVRRAKTPARSTMPELSASSGAAALPVSESEPPKRVPSTAEGWLWKAGEHHTAWKRRWFKLDTDARMLRYFADKEHAKNCHEKGHIDLTGVSEESIRPISGAPSDFAIVTGSRTYHLRADKAEGQAAASMWQTALKHLVSASSGRRAPDVDAASQRFKTAQEAHRLLKEEPEHAEATDRTSRSGVCVNVPLAPVSPWSARDPKPSHVLGYDSPIAHSLGYLGDKGRVPSHRVRYIPK